MTFCLPNRFSVISKCLGASTRIQVIALQDFGAAAREIAAHSGVEERSQRNVLQKVKEGGFVSGKKVLNSYAEDGKKSGAPLKKIPSLIEEVVAKVRRDRSGREKSTGQIAEEFQLRRCNISARSIHRSPKY